MSNPGPDVPRRGWMDRAPWLILGALLCAWLGAGIWICLAAPFASGTDESIGYVAFAGIIAFGAVCAAHVLAHSSPPQVRQTLFLVSPSRL